MGYKFNPSEGERLESPERLLLLPIDRVVALSGVKAGDRVLDAGCGTGVFTVPLAIAAGPTGHVDAIDIEPDMLEACRRRIEAKGLTNVTLTLSGESEFPLGTASLDLLFACQLLHELHDPAAFLAEARRVLRPQGRLVAIDWEKVETGIGPPVHKRLTSGEARETLEGAGFRVDGVHQVTWANYLLLAHLDPASARHVP